MTGPLIFGKYELIRRLAVGGMGEIFLARQTGVVDRLVILKSLLPSLAEDADSINAFLDEARVAAKLNHPNIIGIYEVGRWEGTYFIAMEYVDGENLAVLGNASSRSDTPIPCPVAARIIHGAALGLDYAHHATDELGRSLHVIHRDITPQNIMVRIDGVTKVVDFGIATAANRSSQTATGVVKGKIGYMNPEQIRAEELDGRGDQFSLGVVFWELCTGFRLFRKGKNELEIAQRIIFEEVPPPSSLIRGDFPRELDAIILRMLEKRREARFERCRDVAEVLEDFLRAHPRDGSPEGVARYVKALIGDQLRARTQDLTPQPNFLISFARSKEEVEGRPRSVSAPEVPEMTRSEDDWITQVRPQPAPRVSAPPLPAPRPATGVRLFLVFGLVILAATAILAKSIFELYQSRFDPIPPVEALEEPALFSEDPLPDPDVSQTTATSSAAPGVIEVTASAPNDHRRRPSERPRRPPSAEKRALEEEPRSRAGDGFLSLHTQPWVKVSIGGVPYGSTPLFKLRLRPGAHQLHLVNEQAGVDVVRTVEIAAGETKKLSLDLP